MYKSPSAFVPISYSAWWHICHKYMATKLGTEAASKANQGQGLETRPCKPSLKASVWQQNLHPQSTAGPVLSCPLPPPFPENKNKGWSLWCLLHFCWWECDLNTKDFSYFECMYPFEFLGCLSLLNLKSFKHITPISIVILVLEIGLKKLNNSLRKIDSIGTNKTLITLVPILIICHNIQFGLNKNDGLQECGSACFQSFSDFTYKRTEVKDKSFRDFFSLLSFSKSWTQCFFNQKFKKDQHLFWMIFFFYWSWFDMHLDEIPAEREKLNFGYSG